MSQYAIDHLREANAALEAARENVSKLEAARDALDTKAMDLEKERAEKDARRADLAVDVEMGTASPDEVETLSAEVAALNAKIVDTLTARDRCDERVRAAEKKIESAEKEVRRFSGVVAKPLADKLEDDLRTAYRAFCKLQWEWIKLSMSGSGAPTGQNAMHGPEGDPRHLRRIAKDEGLSYETMTAHPPPAPYAVEDLIESAPISWTG